MSTDDAAALDDNLRHLRQQVKSDQDRYEVSVPVTMFGVILLLGGAGAIRDNFTFPPAFTIPMSVLGVVALFITAFILHRASARQGLSLHSRHYLIGGIIGTVLTLLVGFPVPQFPGAAISLIGIGIVERRRIIAITGVLVGAIEISSMLYRPITPFVDSGLLPDRFLGVEQGTFMGLIGVILLVAAYAIYSRNRKTA